jgi:hypothetical protein
VLYNDATGKFAENWLAVAALAPLIMSSAEWHVQHATRSLYGFTTEVVATIMAANIAVENNWGEVLGRRLVGDIVGEIVNGNSSTGLVNYKPVTAMEIINDCNIPLELSELIRNSVIHPLPYSPDSRLDRELVFQMLQTDAISIDILGADIIRSIYKTADAQLVPSIFNVANYRWIHEPFTDFGPQSAKELFEGANPAGHGEHGVRIVRNFDKAAEVLGLSVRYDSLPNGLQAYYKGIHPADAAAVPPFTKTEED